MSIENGGIEKGPIQRQEIIATFELYNLEDLDKDRQLLVRNAMSERDSSTDAILHAGAAVMAVNGKIFATYNDVPGSSGHAEQRAIAGLYSNEPAGEKKLAMLALAISRPGEEPLSGEIKYDANTPLDQMSKSLPCSTCLGFISDVTANVDDVEFLLVLATGQVLKTSLRSLMTLPYTSVRVAYDYTKGAPVHRPTTAADQNRKPDLNINMEELKRRLSETENGTAK